MNDQLNLMKSIVEQAKKRAEMIRENCELKMALRKGLVELEPALATSINTDRDGLLLAAKLSDTIRNEDLPGGLRQTAYDMCQKTGLFAQCTLDEMAPHAPFADYFEIAAGKLEFDWDTCDSEKNYKAIDRRKTMAEALDLYRQCSDYDFVELDYVNANGERFMIDMIKKALGD